MTELDLMWALLQAAPDALPQLRLFRRVVGTFDDKRGFHVKTGIPGQCDLWGVIRGGRLVELETKAKRGKLSPTQQKWQSFCQSWGIAHLVLLARADETPEATVSRWVEEIRALVNAPLDWELAACP